MVQKTLILTQEQVEKASINDIGYWREVLNSKINKCIILIQQEENNGDEKISDIFTSKVLLRLTSKESEKLKKGIKGKLFSTTNEKVRILLAREENENIFGIF